MFCDSEDPPSPDDTSQFALLSSLWNTHITILALDLSSLVSHAEQVQQYSLEDANGQWLLKFTWSNVICFSEPQDLFRGQHGWSTPSPFYELHVRIQEVSASNFDPTCIKGRRLPKNTMPKDGKNSFSCPHPCPALHPTTPYFPMPKVNITPTLCGFTRHPCTSDILPNFFLWTMHICQYVYIFYISPDQCC